MRTPRRPKAMPVAVPAAMTVRAALMTITPRIRGERHV